MLTGAMVCRITTPKSSEYYRNSIKSECNHNICPPSDLYLQLTKNGENCYKALVIKPCRRLNNMIFSVIEKVLVKNITKTVSSCICR